MRDKQRNNLAPFYLAPATQHVYTLPLHMLYHLVYRSRIARQVRFADAEVIAEQAAEKNQAHQVTGLLMYTTSFFLQVLEGEREVVRETYQRICQDARHEQIEILREGAIFQREFGEWAMRAVLPRKDLSSAGIAQLDGDRVYELLLAARGGLSSVP